MGRHDDIVLRTMAEVHLTYEIERLLLVPPMQAQVAAFVHPIITQSLLEAFLVHLRSLADFVVAPRKPRHDLDVAAEDFYDGQWGEQPVAIFGADAEEHQASMNELHRRLAHISTQRLHDDEFVWGRRIQEWRPPLVNALKAFVSGLPPQRRAWFARAEELLSG